MDFEKAKLNPAAVFKSPQEVVSIQELSREQKIEILQQWEQDARLMEVAEEESMPGPQPKLLQPIRDALHALNYWPDTEHSSPTKPKKPCANLESVKTIFFAKYLYLTAEGTKDYRRDEKLWTDLFLAALLEFYQPVHVTPG